MSLGFQQREWNRHNCSYFVNIVLKQCFNAHNNNAPPTYKMHIHNQGRMLLHSTHVHHSLYSDSKKYSRVPPGMVRKGSRRNCFRVLCPQVTGSARFYGTQGLRELEGQRFTASRTFVHTTSWTLNALTHHTIKTLGQVCTFLPTMTPQPLVIHITAIWYTT